MYPDGEYGEGYRIVCITVTLQKRNAECSYRIEIRLHHDSMIDLLEAGWLG